MKKKYFKIPYVMFGEFDELYAYVEAKDEDSAKRKLVFHLSATTENKEFAIEDLTYGFIEEIKIIMEEESETDFFKIPYVMFGEFDELYAYVEAKDEDSAKRKLVFFLSEAADNKEFAIEDLTYGFIEEIKIIA